jgi:AcrR family transcriptional regulator
MNNNSDKTNIKKMILEAAKELFLEHGINSVSMRKIASKIGYSPTTLYIYYSNKQDILKHLAQDYFSNYSKDYEDILANEESRSLDNLIAFIKLYINRALANPGMYKLMTTLFAETDNVHLGITNAGRGYEILKILTLRCIQDKELSEGNIDLITQILWVNTHGLCSLLTKRPSFHWGEIELLINSSINTVIKGLK